MGANKRGRGRPKYEATDKDRDLVKGMVMIGVPQDHIAKALGISPTTLTKHFRQEIDGGMSVRIAEVANNLFNIATGDGAQAVTAAIFIMKTQAGWKETSKHEHTGADGTPLTPALNVTIASAPVVEGNEADLERPVTH
ncbi:MAG: hypothetical protein AAF141_05565 [Pseudomonadota bacterium]